MAYDYDFPFTIQDVVALLRLTVRRSGPGCLYVDCPLCGDRRKKTKIDLTKNCWHCYYCGEGGGMLALYAKVCHVSNSDAYREIIDALVSDEMPQMKLAEGAEVATQADLAPQAQQATPQEIHQTLSMLLSMLTLAPIHRKHLNTVRGLTDEQIKAFGFKSTPPGYLCVSLTSRLIKAGCKVKGVPGFYVNDKGAWTVKFYSRTSGIIIPIQGADGLIRGLQVRLDRPIKNEDDPPEKAGIKYLTLSSAGKNIGTGPAGLIHFVGDPGARVVYVTEGALKSDVAHALTGRTFVGTIGANNTGPLDALFAFLKRNGTQEIIEAEDMDKYRNPAVDRGASKVYLLARKHGLECRRLTWNPNYKGIDDWQLALRKNTQERSEVKQLTFKELYLWDRATIHEIEGFSKTWRRDPDRSDDLREFLGLTEEEYKVYLQEDLSTDFEALMENQRRHQSYRIYQLDLEGRTVPFAFAGINAVRKAGYQQPPACEYRLVYEGEQACPKGEPEDSVLDELFDRFSTAPATLGGRPMAPSDVVELYDDTGRRYYYRDEAGFVPVQFSPAMIRK